MLTRRSLIWATIAAAVMAATWALVPSRWTLRTRGTDCRISERELRVSVMRRCGPPDKTGDQPKVPGQEFPAMCSAPCDVYGDRLVYYDCEGGVADVVRMDSSEYQGCSLSGITRQSTR